MLMQQETIAGLMRLLEEAKAEAAAVLSPLTRPPSPAKRRALESEAAATGRVRQDRWARRRERRLACLLQCVQAPAMQHNRPLIFASRLPTARCLLPTAPHPLREALIQELRDAFLALADASVANQAALPEFEARIRELHAVLGATGDSELACVADAQLAARQASPHKGPQHAKQHSGGEGEGGSPSDGGKRWAIPAVRRVAAEPAVQQQGAGARLKSALKQPRPGSASPAKPAARQGGGQPAAAQTGGRSSFPRPATAPGPRPRQQQLQWQPDEGLAEWEEAEEQAQHGMRAAACSTAVQAADPSLQQQAPSGAVAQPHSRPASAVPVPHSMAGAPGARPPSQPSSPQRSRPGSPSPAQVSGGEGGV